MKYLHLIIAIVLPLSLLSCAHKSGHVKKDNMTPMTYDNNRNGNSHNLQVVVTNNRGESNKMSGADIFKKYNTAVFMVFTTDGFNSYQGSGFFVNSSGLAVSNYHVFQGTNIGGECIKLPNRNETHKVVEVIHKDSDEDFILFRVDVTDTNYIPIAKYKPSIGERVFAIGSPRGLENTFSSGEVSQWRDTNVMQISALIDHGSSGGALINEYGEVVGITSGTFAEGSQANLNYAWSIDVIKPYVNSNDK